MKLLSKKAKNSSVIHFFKFFYKASSADSKVEGIFGG